MPRITAPKLCLCHKVCHKSQEQFYHVWDTLKQKTATDATWREPKNLNSHNKRLNAITQFTKRTQVPTKSVIHKEYDHFRMIFTAILCHPASWSHTVNTQHYTSLL